MEKQARLRALTLVRRRQKMRADGSASMTIPTIRAFAEVLPRRVDPVNRTDLDQMQKAQEATDLAAQ
jgi:hypothetical protein